MNSTLDSYPWLQDAVKNQHLDTFDFLFAKTCIAQLPSFDGETETIIAFLAITSALWRCGYPFLLIKDSSLEPSLPYISEEQLYRLYQDIPESVLTRWFVVDGNRLYLKKVYMARQSLFDKLKTLITAKPKYHLESVFEEGLSEEQMLVYQNVVNSCFSIICGGPGTGKTYLAAFILRAFLKQFPGLRIAVVAPTGKAANHFKTVLSKDSILSDRVSVQTIHKLLSQSKEFTSESIDLLLVDEGSMVAFDLLDKLFALLTGFRRDDCLYADRMIILGDSNQLPPIGIAVGDPLQDLVSSFPSNVHYLKTSHRAKNDTIRQLSTLILDREKIPFKTLPSREVMIKVLKEKFVTALSDTKHSLCVLTPMRKGLWGGDHLNQVLYNQMQKEHPHLLVPIIATAQCNVFNISTGEVGFLSLEKQELYFQGKPKAIHVKNFGFYTYNYVMSVHKSQGSEYDEVLILLPKGCEMFEMSVLYTAVTRSKVKVSIWADSETLRCITKKPHKYIYGASS